MFSLTASLLHDQHIPLLLRLMCYALTLSRHESLSGTSGPLVNRSQSADCGTGERAPTRFTSVPSRWTLRGGWGQHLVPVDPMSVFSVPHLGAPTVVVAPSPTEPVKVRLLTERCGKHGVGCSGDYC